MLNVLAGIPWWALATAAAVGAVVFYSGNARGRAGPRTAGLILLAAAGLLFGLGLLGETDLARVRRLNGELIQSVPARNWARMTDLLDPDARLTTAETTAYHNRATLVQGAKDDADRWNLHSVHVTATRATQDPSGVTVEADVVSDQDATMGYSTPSTWRFTWDRAGADWRCREITCLRIGNESAGSIARLIK